jgi:hypothetical protein
MVGKRISDDNESLYINTTRVVQAYLQAPEASKLSQWSWENDLWNGKGCELKLKMIDGE